MTRRAFLASRVIQVHRKTGAKTVVKKCKKNEEKNKDIACTDVLVIWLVETEIVSVSRRAILYSTNARQIVARMASGFSKNIFTKMQISRDPVDRFS